MKTFGKSLSGLLSASALAIGLAVVASPAAAQITGSVHDLSRGGFEICVFCHTPHGADTTVVGAPLWNKQTQAASVYSTYTSSTMDGVAGVGAVSLACLSCHDGVQARSNTINSSGSGTSGSTGTLGNMAGFGMANLGIDLRNDHPVGMIYCGAASALDADGFICPDDSFNDIVEVNPGLTLTRYWAESGAATGYQKNDLPLYGVGGPGAQVECATCHDPHGGVPGTLFLRIANNALPEDPTTRASGLCLTCHNK